MLHYQVAHAILLADIVERADMGMIQAGNRFGFTLETLPAFGVGNPVGRQDFDRDGPVQAGIAGFVHFAHAAGAKGSENLVRAQPGAGGEGHVFV